VGWRKSEWREVLRNSYVVAFAGFVAGCLFYVAVRWIVPKKYLVVKCTITKESGKVKYKYEPSRMVRMGEYLCVLISILTGGFAFYEEMRRFWAAYKGVEAATGFLRGELRNLADDADLLNASRIMHGDKDPLLPGDGRAGLGLERGRTRELWSVGKGLSCLKKMLKYWYLVAAVLGGFLAIWAVDFLRDNLEDYIAAHNAADKKAKKQKQKEPAKSGSEEKNEARKEPSSDVDDDFEEQQWLKLAGMLRKGEIEDFLHEMPKSLRKELDAKMLDAHMKLLFEAKKKELPPPVLPAAKLPASAAPSGDQKQKGKAESAVLGKTSFVPVPVCGEIFCGENRNGWTRIRSGDQDVVLTTKHTLGDPSPDVLLSFEHNGCTVTKKIPKKDFILSSTQDCAWIPNVKVGLNGCKAIALATPEELAEGLARNVELARVPLVKGVKHATGKLDSVFDKDAGEYKYTAPSELGDCGYAVISSTGKCFGIHNKGLSGGGGNVFVYPRLVGN
jgi:hypothetical protein